MTVRSITRDEIARRIGEYEARHGCTFEEYAAALPRTELGHLCETDDYRRWDALVAIARRVNPPTPEEP